MEKIGQNFHICLRSGPRGLTPPPTPYGQPDHKGVGEGEGQPLLALTASKCENFDPLLALKFDHLIIITHFISLIVTVKHLLFWTASLIQKSKQ